MKPRKLSTSFLLMLIGFIGLVALAPIGIVWTIVRLGIETLQGKVKNVEVRLSNLCYGIAYATDILIGVVCQYPLNWLMVKAGGYEFGHPQETMSSVYGKNQRAKKNTGKGRFVVGTLDAIDEGHCTDAIDDSKDVRKWYYGDKLNNDES